MTGSDDIAYI